MTPRSDDTAPDASASVRPALEADVPALPRMVGDLARHHGDVPRVDAGALARDLFGPDPWATALVAEDAGRVVGYAVLCRLYHAQHGERGLDLHHLFVAADARGRGIGTLLVAASLREARRHGCASLVVGTHPGNVGVQRFYEALGFRRLTGGGVRFRIGVEAGRPEASP